MSFKTRTIQLQLASLMVAAKFRGNRNEQVDGEIELPHNYHIQVGSDYLILDRSEGEGDKFTLYSGETRNTVIELMKDIAAVERLTTPQLEKFIADSENVASN